MGGELHKCERCDAGGMRERERERRKQERREIRRDIIGACPFVFNLVVVWGGFCSRVSGLGQTEGVAAVREWRFRGGVMRVVAVTEDRSAWRRWDTPGRDRDS